VILTASILIIYITWQGANVKLPDYDTEMSKYIEYILCIGDRISTVFKVLCYKSVGRWFDPSWCQWIFH